MSIFFNTNFSDLRSIFYFNRLSNEISQTLQRLETGQRINSAKDDPAGLITRETMRTDISGIKAAQKNASAAGSLLSTADSALANMSGILIGDINKPDDQGLIGLIYDDNLPAEMKTAQIDDMLKLINSTVNTSAYNGKNILNGSMPEGALFQLGKNVQDSQQYRLDTPSMTTAFLGGTSGTLEDLRTIDLETDTGKAQAYAIVNEAVNKIATQRGRIGSVQKYVVEASSDNLDAELEKVSESEALISNTDIAAETSRLSRAELLAQNAMDAILYARNYRQAVLGQLFG